MKHARDDELYVNQQARLQIPLTSSLTAAFHHVRWEDYDARYTRNEVEVIGRFLRPDGAPDLRSTIGATPPPDGFFIGGRGLLDQNKEFADIGLILGYGTTWWSNRVDLFAPDWFYNEKNDEQGEYERTPFSLKYSTVMTLKDGDLRIEGFIERDTLIRLELPRRNRLVFRYEQWTAGLDLFWRISESVRFDMQLSGELTRKRRRSDLSRVVVEDVDRDAIKAWAEMEVDLPPLWGESASRDLDVLFFGLHSHVLDETSRRLLVNNDLEIGRGEHFAMIGYVLMIPSPADEIGLGLRGQIWGGFLHMREVREAEMVHTVRSQPIAKFGLGLETIFRDGTSFGFFQFTFRVDEPSFGGGNGQVVIRF